MRSEASVAHSLRFNALREDIPAVDGSGYVSAVGPASRSGTLSTNPQNPQRERKKEAKKERESTTATIFVSKTGNYNCRWREIIIDARQSGDFREPDLSRSFFCPRDLFHIPSP
jgi:hypothetical protein